MGRWAGRHITGCTKKGLVAKRLKETKEKYNFLKTLFSDNKRSATKYETITQGRGGGAGRGEVGGDDVEEREEKQ